MGSDQIGNSVHGNLAYEAERAKPRTEPNVGNAAFVDILADAKPEPKISPAPEPEPIDPSVLELYKTLLAAEAERQNLSTSGLKADSVDLIEFQEFKRQVVAAFKHLGLDVRKHFTE